MSPASHQSKCLAAVALLETVPAPLELATVPTARLTRPLCPPVNVPALPVSVGQIAAVLRVPALAVAVLKLRYDHNWVSNRMTSIRVSHGINFLIGINRAVSRPHSPLNSITLSFGYSCFTYINSEVTTDKEQTNKMECDCTTSSKCTCVKGCECRNCGCPSKCDVASQPTATNNHQPSLTCPY